MITFHPETSELVALGQTGKAISALRDRIRQDAHSPMLHVRLSTVLLSAGLGDVARDEAKVAVDLDPKSSNAWMNLGTTLQRDSFGRLRQGDWRPAEAEKALLKAMELDPENDTARAELAILLEYGKQGWRYGEGARLEEAIAFYRELVKKPQHAAGIDQNWRLLYFTRGNWMPRKRRWTKFQANRPSCCWMRLPPSKKVRQLSS